MKTFFITLSLLVSLLGFGQNTSSQKNESKIETSKVKPAYKAGEWLQFRIHYLLFNASFATLELVEDTKNGAPLLYAKGYGETTGFLDLFFKVRDRYESKFDATTGFPTRFIRDIQEGSYTKNIIADFDQRRHLIQITDVNKNKKAEIEMPKPLYDPISAFYYLRNNYDTRHLKKGDFIQMDMFFDDDEIYSFKLEFLGKEVIRSRFGKVECLKVRPYVQSGRVFKESEGVTLWISNDDNKIPIRIVAEIAVGSLEVDLHSFRGLKNPFKIIQD